MHKETSKGGFSFVETLVAILVVAAVVLCGVLAWHHAHAKKQSSSAATSQSARPSSNTTTNQTTDIYAGWKTLCDSTSKACFKYPSDWIASQYGGLQNTSDTAYVEYEGHNNKDQTTNDSYIMQIFDLTSQGQDLKIVGSIDNNIPTYTIYDATDVANLRVGQTTPIVVGNQTFGNGITFVATPGANGISAIKNIADAKAWFTTPDAKLCLRVLQSFYYQ